MNDAVPRSSLTLAVRTRVHTFSTSSPFVDANALDASEGTGVRPPVIRVSDGPVLFPVVLFVQKGHVQ
jgi:hypothetical protein